VLQNLLRRRAALGKTALRAAVLQNRLRRRPTLWTEIRSTEGKHLTLRALSEQKTEEFAVLKSLYVLSTQDMLWNRAVLQNLLSMRFAVALHHQVGFGLAWKH